MVYYKISTARQSMRGRPRAALPHGVLGCGLGVPVAHLARVMSGWRRGWPYGRATQASSVVLAAAPRTKCAGPDSGRRRGDGLAIAVWRRGRLC